MAGSYASRGIGTVTVPVAPVPTAARLAPVRRIHQSATVEGFSNGRPLLSAGEPVDSEWCDYMRVTVGGKDATFLHGLQTIPTGWQGTDPYGSSNATILIPGLTAFSDPASFRWLREGAVVRVEAVKDGARVHQHDPDFAGIVDSIEFGDSATILECSGRFSGWASTKLNQPRIWDAKGKDGGRLLWDLLAFPGGFDVVPHGGPNTGIKVGAKGSRDMSLLGRFDQILGLMVKDDGSSWTLLPDRVKGPRYMRCRQRPADLASADVDFTVYYGAHGVKVSMKRDRVDMISGVWGEGVSPEGERWRNAVYPRLNGTVPDFPGAMSLGSTGDGVKVLTRRLWALGLLAIDLTTDVFTDDVEDAVQEFQRRLSLATDGVVDSALWHKLYGDGFTPRSFRQAHFEPLAIKDATRFWDRGPTGTPIARNKSHNSRVPVSEIFVGYGEHTRKREARRNARAQIRRGGDRNGTLTLTSDPAEMSRFTIREGMVGEIRNYLGGNTRVYVSSRQVSWADSTQPVTLAVSTSAKHYLELAQIKQRNLEARRDPAKHARHQFRRSAQTSDAMVGWEGESGAGVIERTALTANTWNKIQFVGGQAGTIGDWLLTVTDPCQFYVYLFADNFSLAGLNSRVGDPSVWANADDKVTKATEHLEWLQAPARLFIEGWGTPDEPLGFGAKRHTKDDGTATSAPLTGKFRDQGQWTFESPTGFLWLAVYSKAACKIEGRARVVVSDQ